jgi:hypothetical protein
MGRATKFQVSPTFLLQQAAWLYERHLDHVRNQMKKVTGSDAAAAFSTTGGSTRTPTGGVAMLRTGSNESGGRSSNRRLSGHQPGVASRTTTALSGQQRNSPGLTRGEVTTPGTYK